MYDLKFNLMKRKGNMDEIGEDMGSDGVKFEGGGVLRNGDKEIENFMFMDGEEEERDEEEEGINVIEIRKKIIRRLKKGNKGKIGEI